LAPQIWAAAATCVPAGKFAGLAMLPAAEPRELSSTYPHAQRFVAAAINRSDRNRDAPFIRRVGNLGRRSRKRTAHFSRTPTGFVTALWLHLGRRSLRRIFT